MKVEKESVLREKFILLRRKIKFSVDFSFSFQKIWNKT